MIVNKEKATNGLVILAWFVFFYGMIYGLVSETQIFKDFYYYVGVSAMLFAVMILRNTPLFKWYNLLLGLGVIATLVTFLYRHWYDYGYQYAGMLASEYAMYSMVGLVVLDAILSRKEVKLNKDNFILIVLSLLMTIAVIMVGEGAAIKVFLPIFVWFLTPLKKEDWKRCVINMSIAAYLVFFACSTRSLIKAPFEYQNGRYIGIFRFPIAGGLLSFWGIAAGLLLARAIIKDSFSRIKKIIIVLALIAYPVVMLFMFLDRTVILGIAILSIVMYILAGKDKKSILKRLIVIVCLIAVAVVVGCLAIQIVLSKGIRYGDLVDSQESTSYIWIAIAKTFGETSRTGVYEPGTVLNALDYFSSARLGLWHEGIKQVLLWGEGPLNVILPNGYEYGHVHNTYIDWLLRYGWIGGIVSIGWYFSCFGYSIKEKLAGRKQTLYTFYWIAFSIPVLMMERVLWNDAVMFILLLLLYPLMVKFEDEV